MKVFVYGTLRRGQCNSHLLESATYLGTHRAQIGMDMVDMGAFPGLVHYHGDYPLSITVESYEIDSNILFSLDTLEGYPSFYNRKKVVVDGIEGLIYYLNEDNKYSYPVVKGGDWIEYKYIDSKSIY